MTDRPADHSATMVAVLGGGVIAATLYQAPLLSLVAGGSATFVRLWDIAWLCLLAWLAAALVRSPQRFNATRSWPTSATGALWLVVLAAVISLPSIVVTFGSGALAEAAIRIARLALAGMLAIVLLRFCDDRRLRVVVVVTLAVASISALIALIPWVTETRVAADGATVGITRAGGPFGNFFGDGTAQQWWASAAAANNLGFWLSMALTVLVTAAVRARRRPTAGEAVVMLPALLVLAAGLIATHSRESWVAALVGLVVVPGAAAVHRPRVALAVAAGVLATVTASAIFLVPSVGARVIETFQPGSFEYETGPAARIEAWGRGLEWGLDGLPLGWGIGAVGEHPDVFGAATAENVFLQTFAEMGVPGLAALLYLCFIGLRHGFRVLQRQSGLLAAFPATVFVILVVHGTFGNSLGDPTIQVLLAVAAAVLDRMRSPAAL